MRHATVAALSLLGALSFACGEGNDDGEFLGENDGGAFLIIEMPADGTDESITQLKIQLLNLQGLPFAGDLIFEGDDFNTDAGTWPGSTGSCFPFRTPDTPDGFLPASSSCLTFSLVREFEESDGDSLLVTLNIQAFNGADVVASLAKTVELTRGVFLNDPTLIPTAAFNDIDQFIATLAP
jgi:hypothetical protein